MERPSRITTAARRMLGLVDEARGRAGGPSWRRASPGDVQAIRLPLGRGLAGVVAAMAEQAYRGAPTSASISDTLGFALYRKGELDRAETLLAQAVSLAPKNGEIRYHLGLTYAKQGRAADARRALEQALHGGPFPSAAEARTLLESLMW